ncbi:MAG: response regulator, partial [Gammaproteobacteria bacterium]|nr:response regulator [Gammaproteobacteria bacterium]
SVRFIDQNGQELVSVHRDNDLISVTKRKDLQNKSKRNYVKQALKLEPGSVYISEINLNREFGKVTYPYKEVLRISTPIFNQVSGKLAGVVAITAEIGNKLLNIQKRANDKNSSKIFITNDRGGYLLHPDKSKTYSFDLGKRYRIQEDMPYVAKLYLPENKKEQLILLPKHTQSKQVVNFSKIPFDLNDPRRFIAVAIVYDVSSIAAKETGVLADVAVWAILLTLVTVIITVLLSYQLTRPLKNITQAVDDFAHEKETTAILPVEQQDEIGVLARAFDSMMAQVIESQTNLRSINENLELMVAERTRSLEESELQQRAILETINDAIITIDNNGFITSFNPAAETCFGYKSVEILGKNISCLIPDDKQESHQIYMDNSDIHADRIINISRDVEGQRKDKTLFPMELNVSPMQQDGKYGFVATLRDITERQRIDKMKNEFISTVSHELRTPLTSIRGSLGLISGGAVGVLPEEASHMLKIAANNTERLLLLINDILDIQKMESGKLALKFNKLAVMPFLEQAVEDNAAYGAQHNVKFIIDKSLNDAYIYADKDRMMQVMANLLSNAAKFSPEYDVVEISVARHDKLIRISVTDHGKGIPDSFHAKLFEKFTQSDSSDTRNKGGTGLGLSITKVIMETHGGRINFVSREGIGSTFYIELPELVGESQPDRTALRQLSKEKHKSCILIVEDDADIAALLRRMLAEAGFNADIARDAAEARAALKANKCLYSMITLDLMLPDMDGLSFINELRSKPETKDMPVVVISAKADEAKRDLIGSSMGVVDWLCKPIDEVRLLNAVRQITAKNKIPHVLHVEDEQDVLDVVKLMLRGRCELVPAMTLSEAKDQLRNETFDLILLDIAFPDGSGLELLPMIQQLPHPPQVVIFSAYDVAPEYAVQVSDILVKSKTDNFALIEIINKIFKHQ